MVSDQQSLESGRLEKAQEKLDIIGRKLPYKPVNNPRCVEKIYEFMHRKLEQRKSARTAASNHDCLINACSKTIEVDQERYVGCSF